MDLLNIEAWLALVGTISGLVGTGTAFFFWYSAKVRKEYASQRDWVHLKNNYTTLSKFVEELNDDQKERLNELFLEIRDVKNLLNITLKIRDSDE